MAPTGAGIAAKHLTDAKREWHRQLPHQARSGSIELGSFFASARRGNQHKFYGR